MVSDHPGWLTEKGLRLSKVLHDPLPNENSSASVSVSLTQYELRVTGAYAMLVLITSVISI